MLFSGIELSFYGVGRRVCPSSVKVLYERQLMPTLYSIDQLGMIALSKREVKRQVWSGFLNLTLPLFPHEPVF